MRCWAGDKRRRAESERQRGAFGSAYPGFKPGVEQILYSYDPGSVIALTYPGL
jgi:hypothetical protein